jgi:hypothetical protein
MAPRPRLVTAILLSCSVYLIPLIGPHTFLFLGEWIWRSLTYRGRSPGWMALDVGVALAIQIAAGATWYWILGRLRSLRVLALVPLVPATAFAVNYLYLIVLPSLFLIDRDPGVEHASWPVACTVPGEVLAVVGRKPAIVREPGDETFVQNSQSRLARLAVRQAPDERTTCEIVSLGLPAPGITLTPIWIGDRGQALLQRMNQRSGTLGWEWQPSAGATALPLDEPEGRRASDGAPIVAADGSAVAWLTPLPASGQPPKFSIVVRTLASSPALKVVIPLDALERGGYVPLDLDPLAREVLVAIDERTFASVGFDGALRWGPFRPEGVQPLSNTFRRVGSGWVAWDGYKEDDGYVIAWALAGGQGRYRVPRGRGITDLAVTPDGRLLAFSATTSLSIGTVKDAVVVLRAADGVEVFRRALPRYARSQVAFPSNTLFAYTEWDGVNFAARLVHVPKDVRP